MKTVMLLEPSVPVRLSNEMAFTLVERDQLGYYCPKKVWKEYQRKVKEGTNVEG